MSTSAASTGIIPVPVIRPPFNYVPTPDSPPDGNGYYVNIRVSPNSNPTGMLHTCLVDTGSCGIVVPQAVLYPDGNVLGPPLPGVTQGAAVTIPYQPSSEDLSGFSYQVAQLAIGADDNGCAFICENVTVVGVTNNQNPNEGMMGVGFGRPKAYGTNVLLQAPGVNPSYLLSTAGIVLGYTAATLPAVGNFALQQLQPDGASWQTPAVAFAVSSGSGQTTCQGTALLDTGLNLMMIGFQDPGWEESFVGQKVTISWPGSGNTPIFTYGFTVTGTEMVKLGQGSGLTKVYTIVGDSPALPKFIVPIGQKNLAAMPTNFVNTGINVIQAASFFYDSQAGVIGFAQQGG